MAESIDYEKYPLKDYRYWTVGQEFLDKNWGKNYAPYDRDFNISEELFAKIQQSISVELANS